MTNNRQLTMKQIEADAAAARAELAEAEKELDAQIRAIDEILLERKLDDSETAARQKLDKALTANREAVIVLTDVTLQALDKSSEVTNLLNMCCTVNADLKTCSDDLAGIVKQAGNVVKALAAVEKVSGKLAKFVL